MKQYHIIKRNVTYYSIALISSILIGCFFYFFNYNNKSNIFNLFIAVLALAPIVDILTLTIDKIINWFSTIRITTGFGYDVHKLQDNADLVLCGIKINHTKGLVSFSDGDVATHALIDALLGASGLADIGTLFPDNNPAFKNISSLKLLKDTKQKLDSLHFTILNIDLTIVAQNPKLSPFVDDMKDSISKTLQLDLNKINVKATTEEGLGFTGTEKGISAFCITLLLKKH